jgi:hypothetical protein
MNLMGKGASGQKAPKLTAKEKKAGTAYMLRVKELSCVICGHPPPSDAHHWIHDRWGSRKTPDGEVIPLCKEHHQNGPEAIHNDKTAWREKHGPDYSYTKSVQMMLGENK